MKYSITIMTPQEKTSLEKFIDFISEYHIIFCVLVFIIFLGIFITSIYKNSNLKKFILENKKILFLFLLFPFIFFPLIFISGEKFTLDGWFGFIGGYFGIIGAVGAVWWQLNEEKKREKEEIIFSRNEALYSFLTFTCEKSSKFYTLCEVYLRNIINGNTTIFPKEIFLYEKEILLNIFETSDVRIKKYIVLISHSFSEFMLADIKLLEGEKELHFNQKKFYLENFETFYNLNKKLEELLKKIDLSSKTLIEDTVEDLEKIRDEINKIENSYESYFEKDDISIQEIKNKLKEYKVI